MKIPRKTSLYISASASDATGGKPPPFRLLRSLFCLHATTVLWGWIDHRAGPGWMSDTHEADVCRNCGKVTRHAQTY